MNKRGSISKKFFNYTLIALFSMATLLGFSQILPAEEAPFVSADVGIPLSPELSSQEALFARAAQFGSVPVIVGFDVGFQPEGTLLSETLVENQRMAIDMAQDMVLNSLVSYDVRNVKRFDYIPYMAMEVDEAALNALWRNPNIVSIHEDLPLPPLLDESVPRIDAPGVWNWYGLNDGFDGEGIAIAILDTGVDKTHEFLDEGKVVSEACYSTNDSYYGSKTVCPNGKQSQTGSGAGVNCSPSWDGCFHGTHVAGIAAGTGGTGGLEGVAKGADIIAIQVFSKFTKEWCWSAGYSSPCVFSFISDQIKGLERVYALRNKFNIAAVNMSLGGGKYKSPCNKEPQKAIIDNLRSAGIATVIASGNSYYSNALSSPACISSAVSVGATTVPPGEEVADFSNHAYFLDLLAPGVDIYSSVPDPADSYASYPGTSMAAPHVAGAFALLRQANFDASVGQIKNALKDTGVPVSRAGIPAKPRIDVDDALVALGVARPEITLPAPSGTVDSSPFVFEWDDDDAAVQKWELWVGTSKGAKDVFDGDVLGSAVTSQSVDCIPLDGNPLYVRLRFKIDGNWWFIDFEYPTAAGALPAIDSPSPGILTDNMVDFQWNAGDFCVDAWKLYVGTTSPGDSDLYDSGKLPGTTLSHEVKGLPFDGSDLYVRLRYKIAGGWQNYDTQYTAPNWTIGITNVDPPPVGSQLTDRDVTFTWADSGGKVTKWRLLIGSGVGKNDYFDSRNLSFDTSSQTVTKLPYDGRTLYVRLKFKINGIWEYADYQYTAVDTLPKMLTPVPGSTLSGYTVAFTWTPGIPNPHNVKKWRLLIGSKSGENNYYDSGAMDAGATGDTCSVMPTDGSTVHVTLMYKKGTAWKSRKYKYTADNLVPGITAPAGPDLIDTDVLFQWQNNGAYIRNYKLQVGSSSGANDIYDSGNLPPSPESHTAKGLPFDGSTVYVRLKYKSGVKWKNLDYQYTAVDTAPEITSPTPNSTFVHSTVTFEWANNMTVQRYRLLIGKKLGENNLHDSGVLPGGAAPDTVTHTVNKLPINGSKVYVRLKFKVGGVWYKRDYQYTAVTWNFKITSPTPKSRFTGSTATFEWTANGAPVDEWKLQVGTSPGTSDIHNSPWLPAGTTSRTVNKLPTNDKKIYVRLYAKFDEDKHKKDYWYWAKSNKATHRFFNNLLCGSTKFTAKVTICGQSVSSKSGTWSSCIKTNAGTCQGTIYANAGVCGIIQGSDSLDLSKGCHYDWVLDFDGYDWYVWGIEYCPGDCNTPKPWSVSGVLSDPDAAGSIKIIMRGPAEGDFKNIE